MVESVVFTLVAIAIGVILVALDYSVKGRPHVKATSRQEGAVEYGQGVEHSRLALATRVSVVLWDQVPKARNALLQSAAAGNSYAATTLSMLNYWVALINKRSAESDADDASAEASKQQFKDELRAFAMRGDARARCAVAAINGELGEVGFSDLFRLYLDTEMRPEDPMDIGALDAMIGIAATLREFDYAEELAQRRTRYIRRRTVV